jgi:hypothetical protein
MVAGVVVRHEGDIEIACGQKGFATGFDDQIGTALGDGIGGVGDDRFPLDDTEISIIQSGLDTGQKFSGIAGKQIFFCGPVGTNVTGDGDLDLFTGSGTDLEFTVFFCEHEKCSFLQLIFYHFARSI